MATQELRSMQKLVDRLVIPDYLLSGQKTISLPITGDLLVKNPKTESNVNYRVSVYPNVALSLKIHGTTVLDDGPLNSVTLQHPERDCSMAVYTFDGNENVEYLVYDGGMYREIALRGSRYFYKVSEREEQMVAGMSHQVVTNTIYQSSL